VQKIKDLKGFEVNINVLDELIITPIWELKWSNGIASLRRCFSLLGKGFGILFIPTFPLARFAESWLHYLGYAKHVRRIAGHRADNFAYVFLTYFPSPLGSFMGPWVAS
jgi:hypothetical protein